MMNPVAQLALLRDKTHGFDGEQLDFKSSEDPEFIGTVANENPRETQP